MKKKNMVEILKKLTKKLKAIMVLKVIRYDNIISIKHFELKIIVVISFVWSQEGAIYIMVFIQGMF